MAVRRLRRKVGASLSGDGVKFSVGDYLKLLDYERAWEGEETREITVKWVQPEAEESSSGE
jgi:hypothetical protein